jgi:predicted MPP superfamily phosphohydrolase
MMRTKFILIILLTVMLYGAGNYYVGYRSLQAAAGLIAPALTVYYWLAVFAVAAAYLGGRVGAVYFPGWLSDSLIRLGAYWLALSFYLCLLWAGYDILVLGGRVLGIWPAGSEPYTPAMLLGIGGTAGGIVAYGRWNAQQPCLRRYRITIAKPAGRLRQLQVVMVSDLHLGLLNGRASLERLVDIVRRLGPDLVLLPGDILDENIGAFVEEEMPDILRNLRPPLGVFACLGSHEYIWGHADKALSCLQQAGITVLRDSCVQVAGAFYLAGRDDLSRQEIVGTARQSLTQVLAKRDRSLPLILLDHQPAALAEAEGEGVDLQLSGHTHRGQLFPLNLITRRIFAVDWGYLRQGGLQTIVSCGYGTWATPVRVGSSAEIVVVNIRFGPPEGPGPTS